MLEEVLKYGILASLLVLVFLFLSLAWQGGLTKPTIYKDY